MVYHNWQSIFIARFMDFIVSGNIVLPEVNANVQILKIAKLVSKWKHKKMKRLQFKWSVLFDIRVGRCTD